MKTPNELNTIKPAAKGIFNSLKLGLCMLTVMLSSITFNALATEKVVATSQAETRAIAIKSRVAEIQAMDMSHMSRAERKEIRNELKEMKKELKQHPSTYVYISGAGLILIIILLLILL